MRHMFKVSGVLPCSHCGSLILLAAALAVGVVSCDGDSSSDPAPPFADIEETTTDDLGFYLAYPDVHDLAIDLGVKVVNLADHGTYFVFWFPEGFVDLDQKRLLVMLHGTDGVAYRSLLRYSDMAEEEDFGIVAIQWGWPPTKRDEYDYLDPDQTHGIISTALDYLEYAYGIDKHLSGWDGFSRAATRCAVHAHLDCHTGTHYFTLFMGISGGCTDTYPPMADLLGGTYGPDPIAGCHFYLWCGTEDLDGDRCVSLQTCADHVESLGGTVDIFAIADSLDHAEYYMEVGSGYREDAVALWKSIVGP